jgi:hypothetical protein
MNSNFTKIETLASPLSEVTSSDLSTVSLVVEDTFHTGSMRTLAPNTLTTVVGYAPTQFATAGIASSFTFLTAPGLSQATATTDENLLVIPPSARITKIQVMNNGTTIVGVGATLTIGTLPIASGVQVAPATALVTAMTIAVANTALGGGIAGGSFFTDNGEDPDTTNTQLGTAGQAYTVAERTYIAASSTLNLAAVTVNTAALTAGDLVVRITYLN